MIDKLMLYTLKNIKRILLVVFPINLFVLMINLVNQLFFTGEKMESIDLLKQLIIPIIVYCMKL